MKSIWLPESYDIRGITVHACTVYILHFSLFQVENIEDHVQECMKQIRLLNLNCITDQQKAEYKKRKLIVEV